MAKRDVKRAIRLLAIAFALRERPYTARELGERFGVSQRSIERDLEDLQAEPLRLPLMQEKWEWRRIDCG